MKAYKFLTDDYRSGSGNEPPWSEGEERTYTGDIRICVSGYHSSPSWYDALQFAPGGVAAVVEIDTPVERQDDKYVSCTMRAIRMVNVGRALRLYAVACPTRALKGERAAGREPDPRSWAAVRITRDYANGKASEKQLRAAWSAAWIAAGIAARSAAEIAARSAAESAARSAAEIAAESADEMTVLSAEIAARSAAWSTAGSTAGSAEIRWQRATLNRYINAAFREGNHA